MNKRYVLMTDNKHDIDIYIADSFLGRLRGLLGTKELAERTGLLLENCNAIHMFFMRYALDIVYVDEIFQIVKIVRNVKPWHISGCFQAKHTLEFPVGAVDEYKWRVGGSLRMR